MAEAQAEWKQTTTTVLKSVRSFLYIPSIALLITVIFSYSRDVHNIRTSSDPLTPVQIELLDALNIKIPSNESVRNVSENGIIVKYGIIRNCHFQSQPCQKCKIPKNVGFVGDTAILALLCAAVAFTIVNFFYSLVSIHYPNADTGIQLTHVIALLCILSAFIIRIVYNDIAYIYNEQYSTVTFPLIITCGAGFDVTIVSMYLTIITSLISSAAIFLSL